jgi:hypothetical protein
MDMNCTLTKMIIYLHERGFTQDFCLAENPIRLYSALDPNISFPSFSVLVINQFYDQLTNQYIYIHAIETHCGFKGLLLSNTIFFSPDYRSTDLLESKTWLQQKVYA